MKGKRVFTKHQIDSIKKLVEKKVVSSKDEQKKIRDEIRRQYQFYFSDFSSKKGYNINDIDKLIETGTIAIVK